MHAPCPDLDEEQDVKRLEKRGLDREEIARQDAGYLSLQELAPRQAPAGAGPTLRAAKQHRDTRRGRADPELPQLAFDPHVSPPRVLPRHLKDQLAGLRIDRGAPGPAIRPRPLPRDE